DKEELISLVKNYRNQIKDIDFTFTYQIDNDHIRENSIYRGTLRIMCQGENRFLEELGIWPSKEDWENGDDRKPLYRGIFNGENSMLSGVGISAGISPGDNQWTSMHNYVFTNLMLLPCDFLDPSASEMEPITISQLANLDREQANEYMRGLEPDLLMILKQPESKVLGEETLFGAKTVMVELPSIQDRDAAKIWIDVEHGGIPRKTEWTRPGFPQTRKSEISKLTESNGISFPMEGRMNFPISATDYSAYKYTVSPSNLRINAGIPDASFEFVFPPGTSVHDSIPGGASFRILEGEPPKPKGPTLEEIAAHQPPFKFTVLVLDGEGNPKPGVKIQCRYPRWDRGEALIDKIAISNDEGLLTFPIEDVDISNDQYFYFNSKDENSSGHIKFGISPIEDGYHHTVRYLEKDGLSYLVPNRLFESGNFELP
ncbi:MAG: hypothetical protein KC964_29755, partial [Candidatus Omnitrophica bacterium]|nr:hypothetical protein [Candidatus Omnitrophota bacterium]